MNKNIEIALTDTQWKIIRDALKGDLVRQNDMNFNYLEQITEIGKIIEEELRYNDAI